MILYMNIKDLSGSRATANISICGRGGVSKVEVKVEIGEHRQ